MLLVHKLIRVLNHKSYIFIFIILYYQCWLKKQKDTLSPNRQEAGKSVSWTSGLLFGKGDVYNISLMKVFYFLFIFLWYWLHNLIIWVLFSVDYFYKHKSSLAFLLFKFHLSIMWITLLKHCWLFSCLLCSGHCWDGNWIWYSSYKSEYFYF